MNDRRDVFRGSGVMVLPSILSADFARLGDDVEKVMAAGADGIHVDVMDGSYAPNLTVGPCVVKSLRGMFEGVYFDVHLMVDEPGDFVEAFAEAGADCITFHIEAMVGGKASEGMKKGDYVEACDKARVVMKRIRDAGCDVGVSLNRAAEGEVIEGLLGAGEVDMVLVMSVVPGFSGQKFMSEVLGKTRWIKERLGDGVRLEMDGGMNRETVRLARRAGVDVIVAGNAVFGSDDWGRAIEELRG